MSSTWEMQFKDAASSPLAGFVSNVKSAFANINAQETTFNQKLKETGDIIRNNTEVSNGFSSSIKKIITTVGVFAIGREILSAGMAMEQTNTAFKVLLGSVDVAKSKVRELKVFADVSPFNTSEVMAAGQSLLGFGVNAKELLPIMNVLGDVSMGNANKFSSLVDNYGKLVSAQRANTMDLNQFAMQGIPIWDTIGKQIGLSGKALRDYVEQNGVSVKQVNAAMESMTGKGGAFFGMMKAQSETTAGRWSTFVSQLEDFANNIFEALKPMINTLIDIGSRVMPILQAGVMGFVSVFVSIGDFVREHITLFKVLGGVVLGLAIAYQWAQFWSGVFTFATKLQIMWAALAAFSVGGLTGALELLNLTILLNPMFWLVTCIAAVVGAIVWAYYTFDGFRKFLYSLWGAVKQVFAGIYDVIAEKINGLWDLLKGFGKMLMSVFTLDWTLFKEGLNDFTKGFGETFSMKKVVQIGARVDYGWAEGNSKFFIDEEQKKKDAKAKEDANKVGIPQGYDPKLVGGAPGVPAIGTAGAGGAASSSKQVVNKTINIESLVKNFNVYVSSANESAARVKEIMAQALIAAVNDTELATS